MTDLYSISLSYEKLNPQTTSYEHAMVRAAKVDPTMTVYRVQFILSLPSGKNYPGVLMHMFSKLMLEDAVCFNFSEYFEDWIKSHIEENGWPEKALASKKIMFQSKFS